MFLTKRPGPYRGVPDKPDGMNIFRCRDFCTWLFLIIIPGLVQESCRQKTIHDPAVSFSSPSFPYNIDKPDSRFLMPESLVEISSLEYFNHGMLTCIEDENGILYLLSAGTGKVNRKIKFGKKGDYEGNAISGDSAWVIKSNGELFMFSINREDHVEPVKYELPFTAKNDIEGLCYRALDHSLLIACKEEAGINTKLKGRAVYRFDISSGKLDTTPFLHLTNDDYVSKLKSFGLDPMSHGPFKPSGISIHPMSGNIYIISSIGRLLIVINEHKEIIAMVPLPRRIFLQPEGICFSPDGTMFICSEGDYKAGYICQFNQVE